MVFSRHTRDVDTKQINEVTAQCPWTFAIYIIWKHQASDQRYHLTTVRFSELLAVSDVTYGRSRRERVPAHGSRLYPTETNPKFRCDTHQCRYPIAASGDVRFRGPTNGHSYYCMGRNGKWSVVTYSRLIWGRIRVRISARKPAIARHPPQFLQANARMEGLSKIRQRPLSCTSLQTHSVIILSFIKFSPTRATSPPRHISWDDPQYAVL
jgi:hypothetical protein